MNRESRRLEAKRKKAIARELTRMEKPDQYQQGFIDGGNAMSKAAYAAFCTSMLREGMDTKDILAVLRDMDDILFMYAGEEDLIGAAFTEAGIEVNLNEVFPEGRFVEAKHEQRLGKQDVSPADTALCERPGQAV